jgi:hypothetical protein
LRNRVIKEREITGTIGHTASFADDGLDATRLSLSAQHRCDPLRAGSAGQSAPLGDGELGRQFVHQRVKIRI